MDHIVYVEGRGNLMIEYTAEGATGVYTSPCTEIVVAGLYLYTWQSQTLLCVCIVGTVAFVGSHLDVVPANPETWERNPFKLVVEVICVSVLLAYYCLTDCFLGKET